MNLAYEKLADPEIEEAGNESAPTMDDRSPAVSKGGKLLSIKDIESADP